MGYADTPLVAGTVMEWSDLADNFEDMRTNLNGSWTPNIDFVDGGARREHLVRPVIQGFPVNGAFSTFQAMYRGTPLGIDPPTELQYTKWGSKVDRVTIKPFLCKGATAGSDTLARWVLPGGVFVVAPRTMSTTILCQFDCQVRSSTDTPQPTYPTGAGGGETAGEFRLLVHDRSDNTEDMRQPRTMYPLFDTASSNADTIFLDRVSMCTTLDLAAGEYDIALVYLRGNGAAGDLIRQLDLTCLTLHVELF